jgi:hypothetical protein
VILEVVTGSSKRLEVIMIASIGYLLVTLIVLIVLIVSCVIVFVVGHQW